MVRLIYKIQAVTFSILTLLKNSKFVLYLSPKNVGQAANFWTPPGTFGHRISFWTIL